MVYIKEQPKPTHLNYWRAMFTEEEIEEKRCPITKEKFKQFERVFVCEKCGIVFKKTEALYDQVLPCSCNTKYDVEFYNCEVIVQ